jgi:LacI family transcriptional regulator
MMSVSIKDIAAKVGVTDATVSMALRDNPEISLKRRNEIKKVAESMGYQPHLLARGLRSGKTMTIGLITSFLDGEIGGTRILSIENAAAAKGYRVFSCYHGGDVAREQADIRDLLHRWVDGIIAFPVERTHGENYLPLLERHHPLVIVDPELPIPVASVLTDFEQAGYLAVQHMLKIGRRKPAFVAAGTEAYAVKQMMAGWRRGCREGGLDFDQMPFFYDPMERSAEVFYREVSRLLDSGRQFNALVMSADALAVVAMPLLTSRGLRIPEDVAVSGVDNTQLAPYLQVPLTSVELRPEEQSRRAVEMLLDYIQNPTLEIRKETVPVELVVRRSTMV